MTKRALNGSWKLMNNSSKPRKSERNVAIGWPQILSAALLLGGIGLIAWSFMGIRPSAGNSGWSRERARDYQAAAIKLHGLSHDSVHATQPEKIQAVDAELKKAHAEYDALRSELESAIARPKQVAWMLRIGGVVLALVGGGLLYKLPMPVRDGD